LRRNWRQSRDAIPAQAGIHLQPASATPEEKMDAGLRRHDEMDGTTKPEIIPL
jgi:hypothetical protein